MGQEVYILNSICKTTYFFFYYFSFKTDHNFLYLPIITIPDSPSDLFSQFHNELRIFYIKDGKFVSPPLPGGASLAHN